MVLGLGGDQIDKTIVSDHNVEPYHIDEHRGYDAKALRGRIDAMDDKEMDNATIMLFVSPASLAVSKNLGKSLRWILFIPQIVERAHMSFFYLNKAHFVQQNGRHFRLDFLTAVDDIKQFVESVRSSFLSLQCLQLFVKLIEQRYMTN